MGSGTLGAEVQGATFFPDHHPYSSADGARLQASAQAAQAVLVTTEKDEVRLPRGHSAWVLRLRAEPWEDAEPLLNALR